MPQFVTSSALAFLLGSVLLTGMQASAQAPPPNHHPSKEHKKERREEIEGLEQQWRTAQLKADVPAMDKLLADDFLGTTASGQVVTKAQQLDRMRNRTVVITRFDLTDVKVKLIGQVAIVNSLANVEGTADGNSLNGSFRYTRVYQRIPAGSWKITSFSATRIHPGPPPATAQNASAPVSQE